MSYDLDEKCIQPELCVNNPIHLLCKVCIKKFTCEECKFITENISKEDVCGNSMFTVDECCYSNICDYCAKKPRDSLNCWCGISIKDYLDKYSYIAGMSYETYLKYVHNNK